MRKERYTIIGPTYPFQGRIAQCTALLAHYRRRHASVTVISFCTLYPNWIKRLFPCWTKPDPSQRRLAICCIYLLDFLNPLTCLRTARLIRKLAPRGVIIQWWPTLTAPLFVLLARLIRIITESRVLFICHKLFQRSAKFDWMDLNTLYEEDGSGSKW